MFRVASGLRRMVVEHDLAIDLGTANTRLYARGRGVVAEEPSVLVSDLATVPDAAGAGNARHGIDGSGGSFVFPIQAGVVVDVHAAGALLRPLVKRARRTGLARPGALVCTPSDATAGERKALIEATRLAGAAVIAVVPEPLAAALGAGLNRGSPYAFMLVDIGSGVTDIAVIRSGQIIASAAVRTACSDLERAVAQHLATRHGLLLNPGEAARLVTEAGVHLDAGRETLLTAKGTRRHRVEISILVTDREIRHAMDPIVKRIVERISGVLRDLPDSVACEVIEDGICLTGGGSYLPGIIERIAAGTALDVSQAPDPLHSVIEGAAQMLHTIDRIPGQTGETWFRQ